MGQRKRLCADIQTIHSKVTGSLHLCIAKFPDNQTVRFVVDCGLFQERVPKNPESDSPQMENINDILNKGFPFNGATLDFALVTHNHIDHVGRFPLLYKNGFGGKTYMSSPTRALIPHALNDSYKVLREASKRRHIAPLYTDKDVKIALSNMYGMPYLESFSPVPGKVKVTMFKNGHVVGASMILVQIYSYECEEIINLLFTGDYNYRNMFFEVPPLPQWLFELPVTIIQESTYGDMNSTDIVECFEDNILRGISQNKSIVIPAFSFGRYQEVLYFLKMLQAKGVLDPNIPISADGKLAAIYTNMFLNDPALEINPDMIDFLPRNVSFISSSEQRHALISDKNSKIVVATSGMGSYGPSHEYICKFISNPNAMIHFAGYVAEGSLGRRLKDAKIGDNVEIGSVKKIKQAEVLYTSQFSAHAKADEIINLFLKKFHKINFLILNHGEPDIMDTFASRILREVDNVKEVGIASRDTFFRINPYRCEKTFRTHFQKLNAY